MKVLREINFSFKTQTGQTLLSITKLKSPVIIKEGSLHSAFASFTSKVAAAAVRNLIQKADIPTPEEFKYSKSLLPKTDRKALP